LLSQTLRGVLVWLAEYFKLQALPLPYFGWQ
jgi:hypothetical protein